MSNFRKAVKDKFARRELVTAIFVPYASPGLTEFVARLGFDMVFIDTEHAGPGVESIENMIRAAHACGVPAIIRAWSNDIGLLRRYLNYGVDGLLIPNVETPNDIHRVVELIEDTSAPHWQDTILIAMTESVKGVAGIDQIIGLKEVDGIFLGQGDLARSMKLPRNSDNPKVRDAVFNVCGTARKAGKSVGAAPFIYGVGPCLAAGSNFLMFSLDAIMRQSIGDILRDAKRDFPYGS